MICVAEDAEGLQIAARELLEEELAKRLFDELAPRLGARQRVNARQNLGTQRTLGAGYYLRAAFLFWLASRVERVTLMAEDSEGIEAILAASAAFQRAHPPCPNCGEALESALSNSCWSCKKSVRGGAPAGR